MTPKTLILCIVCAVCLSAASLSGQVDTGSSAAYVIQPNDLLTIFVYSHPELSLDVLVQPDGRISIPLVQSIQAAGLSAEQLKPAIEKRLMEVIDVPNVTVIVKAIQSYRIFVTGKVQKPGIYANEKPITVLQAISMAGGLQDYAKKKEIGIVRTIPGQKGSTQQEMHFKFDYEEVMQGSNQTQNIFLVTGDTVVVP